MGVVSSSEKELLASFDSGFEIGFEALLASYESKLYSLCLNLTQSEAETEAVLSSVFCNALDQIQSITEQSISITDWMFRAVIDEAADRERTRHPELERPETMIISVVEDAQIADSPATELELLRIAMRNLPFEYRTIYLLHDTAGFTVEGISSMLELSEVETRAFLHRARLMICRHMRRFRSLGIEIPAAALCAAASAMNRAELS